MSNHVDVLTKPWGHVTPQELRHDLDREPVVRAKPWCLLAMSRNGRWQFQRAQNVRTVADNIFRRISVDCT